MTDKANQSPVIAQRKPYVVDLEGGKTYFWCTCGQSEKQPFCDGSHKDTDFSPQKFSMEEDGKYALCGCKHTKIGPLCDRTHASLD